MASINLEHKENNWLIICYDSLSRVCTQVRFKTAQQVTFSIYNRNLLRHENHNHESPTAKGS